MVPLFIESLMCLYNGIILKRRRCSLRNTVPRDNYAVTMVTMFLNDVVGGIKRNSVFINGCEIDLFNLI